MNFIQGALRVIVGALERSSQTASTRTEIEQRSHAKALAISGRPWRYIDFGKRKRRSAWFKYKRKVIGAGFKEDRFRP